MKDTCSLSFSEEVIRMYRNTWMKVNLDEITENVRTLKNICQKKIIAVLKADAYGCGDSHVARAVLEAGADMLAVSSLDEALMLRNEGYDGELLILGATDPVDTAVMIENNISVPAYSPEWAQAVCLNNPKGLKVHMKVDTGMNRIGFKNNEDLKKAFDALKEAGCEIEGIFTHFCCADFDEVFTNMQYDRFREAVEMLDWPFKWIHCDNSDATVWFRDPLSNACRIGISIYGINTYRHDLHYPISLHTTVTMVKKIRAGEKIGYGATYKAKRDEIIATLPIVYADGFIRANKGRKVYCDGMMCEVTGNVCMDQTMIRLDHEVPCGTVVEIFGPHIHLEDMAAELNTIPYEIICLISGRVTRSYIWKGKEESEENARLLKSAAAEVEIKG